MILDASAESIAEFLGQGVLSAVVNARDLSADDFERWRRESDEIATASARGIANRINDRFVHHMITELDGRDDVVFKERGTTRQFIVRQRVVLRCKRHDVSNRIESYPTAGAIAHWGGSITLDGLSTINLAAGYRWDKELREIGPAVLSYRRGLRAKALWTVELGRDQTAAAPISITPPVRPDMPAIDLFGFGTERKEEDGR
ncbi:hypothetical protein [Agromyces subbeticus]|uniref:hypothetical protein n=1 Tax=Agromyces subbeticus TaxID=293890 RepID=UPI0003B7220B|nr:hypothetical protein [Agromyces subbeticus]